MPPFQTDLNWAQNGWEEDGPGDMLGKKKKSQMGLGVSEGSTEIDVVSPNLVRQPFYT